MFMSSYLLHQALHFDAVVGCGFAYKRLLIAQGKNTTMKEVRSYSCCICHEMCKVVRVGSQPLLTRPIIAIANTYKWQFFKCCKLQYLFYKERREIMSINSYILF